MGRTVLPFSQVLEREYEEWKKFRRALRKEDQEAFDRLFDRAKLHVHAAAYASCPWPLESIRLPREVVSFRAEEHILYQGLRELYSWRIAGAKFPVDLYKRLILCRNLVHIESVPKRRAHVEIIDEQNVEAFYPFFYEHCEIVRRDLFIYREQDLFCLRVDYPAGGYLADEVFLFDGYLVYLGRFHLPDNSLGDLFVFLDEDLVRCLVNDIRRGLLADEKRERWFLE